MATQELCSIPECQYLARQQQVVVVVLVVVVVVGYAFVLLNTRPSFFPAQSRAPHSLKLPHAYAVGVCVRACVRACVCFLLLFLDMQLLLPRQCPQLRPRLKSSPP